MTPEQKIHALGLLLSLREDNRISIYEFNIGSILLARESNRIDYLVLAGLIGMTAPTTDTLLKRVRTCLANLEATGMFRRVKEGKVWVIQAELVSGKNTPVFTGRKTEQNTEKNTEDLPEKQAEVLPERKTGNKSANNSNYCDLSDKLPERSTEQSAEDLPEKQAEELPDHIIQDSSYEESNQIQLPMTTKAPLTEVKGAGGVPLSPEMLSAIQRVYKRRNENFKLLSGRTGSNAAVAGNKLVPDAQSVQKYLKALIKSGVAAFGFQKNWGPMGLEGAIECLCAVLDIVARNDHFKRHPNYYAFSTIFNTEFPKRLGWLIDSGWTPGTPTSPKDPKKSGAKHAGECEFRQF